MYAWKHFRQTAHVLATATLRAGENQIHTSALEKAKTTDNSHNLAFPLFRWVMFECGRVTFRLGINPHTCSSFPALSTPYLTPHTTLPSNPKQTKKPQNYFSKHQSLSSKKKNKSRVQTTKISFKNSNMLAAHNLHVRNPGANKAVPKQIVATFLQLLQDSVCIQIEQKRHHLYSTQHPAEH